MNRNCFFDFRGDLHEQCRIYFMIENVNFLFEVLCRFTKCIVERTISLKIFVIVLNLLTVIFINI